MKTRRYLTILLVSLLAVLVVSACGSETEDAANTAGAPGLGDEYYPNMGNGGYDVEHYDIDLSASVADNAIDGSTTIRALATQDLTRFNLDFNTLEIQSVTVDGAAAEYSQVERELSITPAERVAKDALFTVVVQYRGKPSETELVKNDRETSASWENGGSEIVAIGEPTKAWVWFPGNHHPLDAASYSFRFTVPKPYMAVLNGIPQPVTSNGDGTRTYAYEAEDRMASYLVTLSIVKNYVISKQVGPRGIPIFNYWPKESAQQLKGVFAPQPRMLAFLIDEFGPYPYRSFGSIVERGASGMALETATLVTYGGFLINTPKQFAQSIVLHEMAHMWFGDSVALVQWKDIWLNEGFATYAGGLWADHEGSETLADSAAAWSDGSPGGLEADMGDEEFEGEVPKLDPGETAEFLLVGMEDVPAVASEMFSLTVPQALTAIDALDTSKVSISRAQAGAFVKALPSKALSSAAAAQVTAPEATPWADFKALLDETADGDVRISFDQFLQILEGLPLADIPLDAAGIQRFSKAMNAVGAAGEEPSETAESGASAAPSTHAGDDDFVLLPPGAPPEGQLFNSGVYLRGALTLYALREQIGAETMSQLLKTYYQTYRDSNVTTADFIGLANEISGQNLDAFFEAWLYDTEMPSLEF